MTQAPAPKSEDQSMEEILQSIRRIITEEDGAEESALPEEDGEKDVTDSDILELTEILPEEDAVPAEDESPSNTDILSNIDAAIGEEPAEAEEASADDIEALFDTAEPEELPQEEVPEIDMTEPDEPALEKDPDTTTFQMEETLVSHSTAEVTSAMLSKVKDKPAAMPASTGGDLPDFASGMTMEALVMQMMKPMLKDWLDAHLPEIVERVVAREIQRISNS